MRKVKCYACGKSYDYDEDGFCPNCGGFNQPRHGSAISAEELLKDKLHGSFTRNRTCHSSFAPIQIYS